MGNSAKGKLEGKRALITGASSGVGMETAKLFVSEGASVGLVARRSDVLADLASSLGEGTKPYTADIADDKAIARVVDEMVGDFGRIDLLVNSAGMDGPAPLEDLTPDVWRRQIDVNLSGTFYVNREVALRMKTAGNGGVIINLGSELSLIGMGWFSHYCASKFGVVGLTKALAHELAPEIRVNCVCPGPINTPMMDSELEWFPDPDKTRQEAIDRVPMKRFAEPSEVARAILYFATDATYATGSIFSLDGGTTCV